MLALWPKRTPESWLQSTNGPQQKIFKQELTNIAGHMFGQHTKSSNKSNYLSNLVGTSNEVQIRIGSVNTTALLDTGSSVSTISSSFYKQHFADSLIHPIQEILKIECADGNELPYEGFIETDINILESKGTKSKDNTLHKCLFLIVPDSKYNSTVPVLVGTNILSSLMGMLQDTYGDKYLQEAN